MPSLKNVYLSGDGARVQNGAEDFEAEGLGAEGLGAEGVRGHVLGAHGLEVEGFRVYGLVANGGAEGLIPQPLALNTEPEPAVSRSFWPMDPLMSPTGFRLDKPKSKSGLHVALGSPTPKPASPFSLRFGRRNSRSKRRKLSWQEPSQQERPRVGMHRKDSCPASFSIEGAGNKDLATWGSKARSFRPSSEVSDLSSKARRISVVVRSPSAMQAVSSHGTGLEGSRRGSDQSEHTMSVAATVDEPEIPKSKSALVIQQCFSWVCADRDILLEQPGWSVEEKKRWQSRAHAGLLSTLLTSALGVVLGILYVATGNTVTGIMPLSYACIMVLLFLLLRLSNSTSVVGLGESVELFNRAHIFLVLVVPQVTDLSLGGAAWNHSSDNIIWSLLAPLACLFCMEQSGSSSPSLKGGEQADPSAFSGSPSGSPSGAARGGSSSHSGAPKGLSSDPSGGLKEASPSVSLYNLDNIYASLRHTWVPVLSLRTLFTLISVIISIWTGPTCDSSCPAQWVVTMFYIINHTVCPLVITFILRQTMFQCLHRRAEIIRLAEALCRKLIHIERLVRSLVPEFLAASQSHHEMAPSQWHQISQNSFTDCTIIQMDVVEFTTLASSIDAQEVIDLINALFTSIDHVASCIGNVWKVETIGDCYIAVIGGPNPCEDHAEKAIILGTCIIENAKRISRKTVDIRVRIGIHTGDVMAGFIGSSLPRYLIYGEACEVVRKLESTGKPGMLHISEATKQQIQTFPGVKTGWKLNDHTGVDLPSGKSLKSYLLDMKLNFSPVRRAWKEYPLLSHFESWFCATSFKMTKEGQNSVNGEGGSPSSKRSSKLAMNRSFILVTALSSNDLDLPHSPPPPELTNGSSGPPPGKEEPEAHEAPACSPSALQPLGPSSPQPLDCSALSLLPFYPATPERTLSATSSGPPSQPGSAPRPKLEILTDKGICPEALRTASAPHEEATLQEEEQDFEEPASLEAIQLDELSPGMPAEHGAKEPRGRAPPPTPIDHYMQATSPNEPSGKTGSQESKDGDGVLVEEDEEQVVLSPLGQGGKNHSWAGLEEDRPSSSFVRQASEGSPGYRSRIVKRELWIDVHAPASPEHTGPIPQLPRAPKGSELREALASIASKMEKTQSSANFMSFKSSNVRLDDSGDLGAGIHRGPRYLQDSLLNVIQNLQLTTDLQNAVSPNSDGSRLEQPPTPAPGSNGDAHDRWGFVGSGKSPAITSPNSNARRHSLNEIGSTAPTPESLSLLTYWSNNSEKAEHLDPQAEISHSGGSLHGNQALQLATEGANGEGAEAAAPLTPPEMSEMQLQIWFSQMAADSMRSALHQHVIAYFLVFCGLSACIQSAVLLSLPLWTSEGDHPANGHLHHQQLYGISPGIFAVVALAVAAYTFRRKMDSKGQHFARVVVQVLLFIAPVVMGGGFDGVHSRVAVLWAYCSVVIQCNFSDQGSHSWKWLTVGYCILVVVFHLLIEEKMPYGKVQGWSLFLHLINHLVPTTMSLLPFILTVSHLEADEKRDAELLRQKQSQVDLENQLLEALMPQKIALRLRDSNGGELIADRYDHTTILFIYVSDYESLLFEYGPEQMIGYLNEIFCKFDDLLRRKFRNKIVKMETFSNFYLAVAGCPEECEDHAQACTAAAIRLMELATSVIRPDGEPTSIRVGLSSGPVCAGVVGNTGSPRFSIFGDTVNTASRMASNAEVSTISRRYVHLSESTAVLVDGSFIEKICKQTGLLFGARGAMSIKGKGEMTTYTLTDPELDSDKSPDTSTLGVMV